jgi:PelA/Pel-15E family pectate lyase
MADPSGAGETKEMSRTVVRYSLIGLFLFAGFFSVLAADKTLVVDAAGGGDFKTIQEAINSLPEQATSPRVILIRKGIYHEKIFIEKNFVTLVGEDKTKTIITISLARDIWRCENKDDWGVATINLKGSDIELDNLTVMNSFGFDNINNTEGIHIDCPGDSLQHFKTVKRDGHQMALRSFNTTRLIARNCVFRAFGGDTVSPWNTEDGMFYFQNCVMEGGVDFYCPRGWAFAENCEFIAHSMTAAIWHDGSKYKDSKTVLVNCRFKGDPGFKLGRYHRDAQFYLVNCFFSKEMADAPVYLNPSQPQNTIQWGHRVYFANCHREGGDYKWFSDNLSTAEGTPVQKDITIAWAFAGKWNPSSKALVWHFPKSRQPHASFAAAAATDTIAEKMLLYQRSWGGWPKAVNEVKVDYSKPLTAAERLAIRNDSLHIDPTIDNSATTREIRYLVKAYKTTQNKRYLEAAEKGIRYLLRAQYKEGGWPQYFPDSALYRSQITYNDDAMVNVLNVLQDLVEGINDFDQVSTVYIPLAKDAVKRGLDCILRTQIRVNGKLTAWCAQYNHKTFEPEMARKFELASISGSESVGIVRFLMRIQAPSPAVKDAVTAAVEWFETVKIKGYKYGDVTAADQPKGKDRIIQPDAGSTIWARFYEIGTNRPFFSGRDSRKKYDLREIEWERRTGYGWYGTWPAKLLTDEYPNWRRKNNG